jgi:hypothetical protein
MIENRNARLPRRYAQAVIAGIAAAGTEKHGSQVAMPSTNAQAAVNPSRNAMLN